MKHKTPSPIRIQSQALLPSFNPFTSILNKTTPQPTTLDNPKSKFLQSSVYFCLIPGRSSSPLQSRHSLPLQDEQKVGQTYRWIHVKMRYVTSREVQHDQGHEAPVLSLDIVRNTTEASTINEQFPMQKSIIHVLNCSHVNAVPDLEN